MAGFLVAVTGGVASGKSAATHVFESLGVPVVDADIAARAVVEPGQPALAAVADRFGPEAIGRDGRIYCITTLFHNIQSNLGGQRLAGRRHRMGCYDF